MTAKSYPGLRPISDNSFRVFLVNLPQTRHPERSAAQIDRVTQRLWRGVEGPRRCLSYPCCSELFNHRARHGFFSGAENQKLLASRYVRRLHLHSRQPYRHALHWRSPATCISVSYNIKKVRGKVSVRPMAASACSILNATKIFAQPSPGKNNSKAGGAQRSSTSLARSIPSSKTLHRPGDGR
jgi:hypothetical protein